MPMELPLQMWGSALGFHAVAFRGQDDACSLRRLCSTEDMAVEMVFEMVAPDVCNKIVGLTSLIQC
jgi:hypothetical protein